MAHLLEAHLGLLREVVLGQETVHGGGKGSETEMGRVLDTQMQQSY
jgi:hypothetical protein